MAEVKAEQVTRVASFISSVNNLINGKFILADVKIAEVLKKIGSSDELFNFVSKALIGFNFEKEFRKAEIKNRFNGGVFKLPSSAKEAVALVFCLLVEFDTKRIDFYDFIKENFPTTNNKGDHNSFANTILVPFRDIIASEFGLSKEDNEALVKELETQVKKEQEEIMAKEAIEKEIKTKEDILFESVDKIAKNLYEIIKKDNKLKNDKKEDILFILKGIIYSGKYKDIKILNSLLVCFEHLSHKVTSIKFVYAELKNLLVKYYNNKI